MMLQYKTHNCLIVCLLLWLVLHNSESSVQIIFSSNGNSLRKSLTFLNNQVFDRFFNCMANKYNECIGYYNIIYEETRLKPIVYETWRSDETKDIEMSYYYKCHLFDSKVPYYFRCIPRQLYGCQGFVENCLSDKVGVVLNANLAYILGDYINNCTYSCSYRTFYTKSIKPSTKPSTTITTIHSEQITLSSTSKSTINATYASTTEFPLTTINRNTDLQTLNRTTNSSTFYSNSSDNSTISTIIISVCVAGVVIIIVSIICFLLWRKGSLMLQKSDNEKNKENNSNYVNDSGSQFLSITKEENKPRDLQKTGHEAVVNENNSCFIVDNYTTIAEGRDNYIKLESVHLKQNFGTYNNVNRIHDSIPNVLNYEKVVINAYTDQDTDDRSKMVNVEYYSSVDTVSSDYQRLGQERREFKNLYDQLPPLFKEQQLVQSDQELSPYSLTKPVLGETTLQVIDVGAWAYNYFHAERASIDSSYPNNLQDGELNRGGF